MLIDFFEKLKKSKWLPWVGTAPFIILSLVVMFNGEVWRGIGIFAFFASMWVGIILGGYVASFIATHLPTTSEGFGKRLTAAVCAFGFLFLPAIVASWTNTYLNTDIGMQSLGAHFLWACFGGGIFFCISPVDSKA